MPRTRPSLSAGDASSRGVELDRLSTVLRELAQSEGLELTVRGDCMAPGLLSGERILVRAVSAPLPGDLVAVLGDHGRILVHRYLGWRPTLTAGGALITCADSRAPRRLVSIPRVDPPVALGRLIGRVHELSSGGRLDAGMSRRCWAVWGYGLLGVVACVRRVRGFARGRPEDGRGRPEDLGRGRPEEDAALTANGPP